MKTNRTALEVLFAVLGSVCGMLIAQAVQDSLAINLVGAVTGAAIPPFVSAAGRYRHLRATSAVVVALIALGITYSGTELVSVASGDPVLPSIVQRRTGTTVVVPPSRSTALSTTTSRTITSSSTARPGEPFDLVMQAQNAKCLVREYEASGQGTVRITFHLLMAGTPPHRLPLPVTVAAVSNLGGTEKFVVPMDSELRPAGITVRAPTRPTKSQHRITITADAENAIKEASEANNSLIATITAVAGSTPLCTVR
jgi:hypothetical protein